MEQVHVINLQHRTDRMDAFTTEAARQGVEFRRWDGILNKGNPKMGICQAHKQIVRYAQEENMERIFICEDDCAFFGEQKGAFDFFVKNIPNDYDMKMGLVYVGDVDEYGRVTSSFSGGMTFYVVNQRFYSTFLSIEENVHIDRHLGNMATDYKFYVSIPYVAYQVPGYSDNRHQKVLSYSVYLEGKDLYTSQYHL